ncbi:Cbb3-type cytochrome oxidase component FixQ [Methylophaga frappieri]|uniref:Cbb3-type cytochrome oxidase component FixQ n=1 Tax=Methylophaga frappieri (strain ATCC BAA-2434 / DSM 25690 / JAM7) TaxID=754477 RepID=I1YFD9_METFJ|nr:cbb3-type cytochrome c oxidase subunit 3 [Methylophaga frappieri]AFJ01632.1 Cbb3-type cytochrome oxidase component FixQ [Methylophaga frappieri]
MSEILSYFETNWHAMTVNDWIGTILTVIIFLLMLGLYIWVLRPKNKEKIESHRNMLFDEDGERNSESKNG